MKTNEEERTQWKIIVHAHRRLLFTINMWKNILGRFKIHFLFSGTHDTPLIFRSNRIMNDFWRKKNICKNPFNGCATWEIPLVTMTIQRFDNYPDITDDVHFIQNTHTFWFFRCVERKLERNPRKKKFIVDHATKYGIFQLEFAGNYISRPQEASLLI